MCCCWGRLKEEAKGLLDPVGVGLSASSCVVLFGAQGLCAPV